MRRSTRHVFGPALWVLCIALLAAPALDTAAADEDAGWWSDLDKGEVVRLGDVVAQPRTHSGRSITFFCVFRKADRVFIPQSTVFSRLRHANLSVWPDVTPLWQERDYTRREFPFLYAPRRMPTTRALLELPQYTRIEVTGRVRSIYRGHPCIEIESWRAAGHRLGREVVDAMVRGDALTGAGQMRRAMDWYQRALRSDLPPTYAILIRNRIASSLRRMGALEEAVAFEQTGRIPGHVRHAASQPRTAAPAPSPGRESRPAVGAPPPNNFGGATPPPNDFGGATPPPSRFDRPTNPDAAPDGLPGDAFFEPLPPPPDFSNPDGIPSTPVGPRPPAQGSPDGGPLPGLQPVAPGSAYPSQPLPGQPRPGQARPGSLPPGTALPGALPPGSRAPVPPRGARRALPPTNVPRGARGAPKRKPRLVGVR